MEIILHAGAHRTASTTFQAYLAGNAAQLAGHGIGVWGPTRTRRGLLAGVNGGPGAARARGRIALNLEAARRDGVRWLIVSDENMLGAPRANLREATLYRDAGARIARHVAAFGCRPRRIALSIRAQAPYWESCLAFAVMRGHRLPDAALLDRLVTQPRGWRAVITDIAAAAGGAEVLVLPHETYAGLPETRLWHMAGHAVLPPLTHAREWLHRRPDLPALRGALRDRGADPARLPGGQGSWRLFDDSQRAALEAAYRQDLDWLRAGADGLARLVQEDWAGTFLVRQKEARQAGTTSAARRETRGQAHGTDEGRVA